MLPDLTVDGRGGGGRVSPQRSSLPSCGLLWEVKTELGGRSGSCPQACAPRPGHDHGGCNYLAGSPVKCDIT